MKKWVKVFLMLFVISVALIMATAIYASDYYRAVAVDAYITSGNAVAVSQIDEGYFFDGPGTEDALIFYPGAKVDETSYAPLLNSLAEQGVDCFLVRMPMKLAFLGMNNADNIRAEYSYAHYYLAGHSLGGAMAADYAVEHTDEYSGLFLLAAYPSKDLSKAEFPVVFIYGENDLVLSREKLNEGFSLVPSDYSVVKISGGNHSQFGSYGEQDGDGNATISAEEQQKITVDAILSTVRG